MPPLIFFMIILIVAILFMYNSLVVCKNKVKQAESSIDVYLTQRFDLIPNLVECVKAYSKFEKETLTDIAKLRSNYYNTKDLKQGSLLNSKCNQILAIAENYPELKSSEHFLNLQKSLSKMENQLQAARRLYNSEVTIYNTKIHTIPFNILASAFGFHDFDLFELEDGKDANINIKL